MVQEAAAPEVGAGEGIRRGDDVPAGAATGQLVKGGELPCHLEGFVEGGVDRPGQPDPVGDARQGRQHGEGVRPAHDVEIVDPAPVLTQPQPFGQEEEVEQSSLGGSGEVGERVEFDLAAGAGIGPHGGVVDPREVSRQVNRLAVLTLSELIGDPPAFGDQLVGAQPVLLAVSHRGDDEFVGAGDPLQCL